MGCHNSYSLEAQSGLRSHRRHLLRAAVDGLKLLDTARAVAEFDLPMRVLGLWWLASSRPWARSAPVS
jgi:hypothetical protein